MGTIFITRTVGGTTTNIRTRTIARTCCISGTDARTAFIGTRTFCRTIGGSGTSCFPGTDCGTRGVT
ncbi:Protein of unknown function [Gryllus bimaculatus]|nr:Protein of unknown function [Gryllus bimaculatus]